MDCPECGKEIEVTTMTRPRRGRKPGSTNAAPLTNPIPPKPKEKEDELDIENLDIENTEEQIEDDTVLLEDETDIDPSVDVGIKPHNPIDRLDAIKSDIASIYCPRAYEISKKAIFISFAATRPKERSDKLTITFPPSIISANFMSPGYSHLVFVIVKS